MNAALDKHKVSHMNSVFQCAVFDNIVSSATRDDSERLFSSEPSDFSVACSLPVSLSDCMKCTTSYVEDLYKRTHWTKKTWWVWFRSFKFSQFSHQTRAFMMMQWALRRKKTCAQHRHEDVSAEAQEQYQEIRKYENENKINHLTYNMVFVLNTSNWVKN